MKRSFVCKSCGHVSPKWLGRCPECGTWESMEERVPKPSTGHTFHADTAVAEAVALSDVSSLNEGGRIKVGMGEVDRVLGGGLVPGGLVLLGGEPGIGKSTLLLQLLMRLEAKGEKVLYVSGEESLAQLRLRADRLGRCGKGLFVASESGLDRILGLVDDLGPSVLAIDSVQTLSAPDVASAPGSITQVRESTAWLMKISKRLSIPVIIIGHVTKDGAIAGPRVLEHLVDTVLYFEGDRSYSFRILRSVKNRYGPTHEIGIFEMRETGLEEVPNPSRLFLGQYASAVPGSVIVPCMEGSRPILVEIQALVNSSYLAMPRRTVTGFDTNRLALLVAVAERHLGVVLYDKDIFINVAGGIKVSEPASDLAIIAALVSSLQGQPVCPGTAFFGEVGLTGEVRPVGRADIRLNEVARLGLRRCVMPILASQGMHVPEGVEVLQVNSLKDAINAVIKVS